MSDVNVLDGTYKDLKNQIYEADGIRGTLKELSDHFNVDPVSVSDLLSEGMSFEDALCMALPGFKPKPKKKRFSNKLSRKKSTLRKVTVKRSDNKLTGLVPDKIVSTAKGKSVKVPGGKPISTQAFTDVQDLGDILVFTTTTTVVYRKEA